jgi:hypothetical protein
VSKGATFIENATEEQERAAAMEKVKELTAMLESGECRFFVCAVLTDTNVRVLGNMTNDPPWPARMQRALALMAYSHQQAMEKANALGEGGVLE